MGVTDSIRRRGKRSWRITLELGYVRDPETGVKHRIQKPQTFRGTKSDAERKLNELIHAANHDEYVEPSKITVGEWLSEWLRNCIVPRSRPSTVARYTGIIENDLLHADFARLPLQMLRASHIEAYFGAAKAEGRLSGATLMLHHTVLHSALTRAAKDRLVVRNVAADLDGKPRRLRDHEDARRHAWTLDEARDFLAAAASAGPQPAAFYGLALDSGMRKAELCGLKWEDVDLAAGKVHLVHQLTKGGSTPTFGPLKNGRVRTISISPNTVERLRVHKKHQAAMKMANRQSYADHGLVFAKEWTDLGRGRDTLGHPLQMNNLGQREYARLIKTAGVRPIKFHGLRHTCATLLLKAGEPVHVVAERLGHMRIEMTLNIYAHVLPDMQADAAKRLGSMLYGAS